MNPGKALVISKIASALSLAALLLPAALAEEAPSSRGGSVARAALATLGEAQKDLAALMARPQDIDPAKAEALIDRLIALYGPSAPGTELATLRHRLVAARDMRALSLQLEAETLQAEPDTDKIQKLIARLRGLQTGLAPVFASQEGGK